MLSLSLHLTSDTLDLDVIENTFNYGIRNYFSKLALLGSFANIGLLMSETDPSLQGIPPEEAETPPKPIRRLRGFFFDPNGGLHRGVPTWVVNEDGSETPVFREHNTGKIFPRIETPPPVDTPPEG